MYNLQDASPQAISERTSYCQVRLEFLLYTQVIPECCTTRGCGPPRSFTHASPCSYVAHLASGLVHTTIIRPIKARFHCVSGILHPLDGGIELTRWIVLQKARGHPLRGSHSSLVLCFSSISLPFRGSFHLSLTVLVRYRSEVIFSLGS